MVPAAATTTTGRKRRQLPDNCILVLVAVAASLLYLNSSQSAFTPYSPVQYNHYHEVEIRDVKISIAGASSATAIRMVPEISSFSSQNKPKPETHGASPLSISSRETNFTPSSVNATNNVTLDYQNETILYVHIGKTGGTTLDKVLRSNCEWYQGAAPRSKCFDELHLTSRLASTSPFNDSVVDNESMLSKLTKASFHVSPLRSYSKWINKTTMFLVSIRNPITRAVSAFNYEHLYNNPKYYDHGVERNDSTTPIPGQLRIFYDTCFPAVEDMAQLFKKYALYNQTNGENTTWTEQDQICFERGYKTLLGKGSQNTASHLRYNYEFYGQYTYLMKMLPQGTPRVLAIRTEHLWEDTKNVDKFLGGDGVLLNEGKLQTHGSEGYSVQSGLSQEGERILCCVLAKEIEIYERILQSAINLSDSDKEEMFFKLYRQCGIEDETFSMDSVNGSYFSWNQWAKRTCPVSSEW